MLVVASSVHSTAAAQEESSEATSTNAGADATAGNSAGSPSLAPSASQSDGNTVDVALTGELRNAQQVTAAPGVPAWLQACTFEALTTAQGEAIATLITGDTPAEDPGNGWVALICPGSPASISPGTAGAGTGLIGAWPIGAQPPQVVLDVLIAQARASLELPLQVGQAAPFGDTDAPLITQLPTWLWIDPAVWAPRSASTPAVFGVFVTATATPTNVTFANDAGDSVNCGANVGPAYNFALDDSQQDSPCTLTYKHSTAVGAHSLTTTLTW
ncbi:MAG: hypothetical protein AAGD35_23760, partial [Actinomycetota bacterium]